VKWSISVKKNIELIKFNFLFAYNFIPHKGYQEIYNVIESPFPLISFGFNDSAVWCRGSQITTEVTADNFKKEPPSGKSSTLLSEGSYVHL
jgi:hypothetical protein